MDRREFLTGSLLGAASLLTGCGREQTASAPTSATAPPWKELGVQLYTVRAMFEADFRKPLKAISDIGYKDLEFAGYYDHDPAEVKAYMDELNLFSHSTHVRLDPLRDNFAAEMEIALQMGQRNMFLNWLAPEERTADAYRAHADLLNQRGAQARANGLQLGYHNHDFEFETVEGIVPFDLLMERTDPDLVKFELDLYWVEEGGQNAVQILNSAPGRFLAFHLKDRAAQGKMSPVGDGTIDFNAIFKHAEAAGVQHYYVEQDDAADPLVSLQRSYAHLA